MFDDLQLRGEGFELRRWRQDDLDALLMHANDPRVPRGLSTRFPHPYTRADGEAFLAGKVVDLRDPVLAIVIDGQACGSIALRRAAGGADDVAELGYWLGRVYWGRGWMTRSVQTYLAWALHALPLTRIDAPVLDSNPASAQVLRKNGFVAQGVRRGALLRPDGAHDLHVFSRFAATR